MAEGAVVSFWAPITKVTDNDDGTVTVRGKISSEAVDFDNQIVDRGLVKRLLPKYMAGWRNVRVGHDGHWPAGKAIDAEWDQDGDAVLTARVIEPDAARLVREGVLQGFSVNIAHPKIRPDPRAKRGRIYDGDEFSEISLVDRPSNPDSRIDIIKAAGYRASNGQDLTGATPGEVSQAPYGEGPAVPTGWLSADTSRTTGGNVRDPAAGNSEDFDALGDPVLQPGHVQSNEADISVVTMDSRGAVVQVGDQQFLVPYRVESDGLIHWGEPEPMPRDPRAAPLPPGDAALQTDARKGSDVMGASVARVPEDAGEKGVWSTAEVDELPDAAFAYVAPGADHDKAKRHLPYRDRDGKIDAPHVRNALARLDQTDIPPEAKADARRKLEDAAREVGIEVSEPKKVTKVADIKEAAEKAMRESAHCVECGKRVKCVGEALKREPGAGGDHAIYRGECGHHVHRFEPKEGGKSAEGAAEEAGAPKGTEEPKGSATPTGLGPDAGSAKGNTTGERPPHTEQPERQEDDLIRRMRKALDDYTAAQAADRQGKPGAERGETAALEQLRQEVGAALGIQRQEANEPKGADPKGQDGHEPDGVRGADDEGTVEKVAAALLGRLGYTPREIAKAACGRHKEHLREAAKRLSQHIEEIPEDPLAEHRSEKGTGFGTGAPKDPANAPERNDGGPAPAEAGDWRERIREDIAEIGEFAQALDRSTEELVHGGPAKGSRLVREGSPDAPGAKPAGSGSMEFRNATESSAPARDTREIPKGAGAFGPPPYLTRAELEGLMINIGATAAEAAAKAVGAQVADVRRQVDAIAHAARPAQPPAPDARALEPSGEFAAPQAAAAEKGFRTRIGEQWNALPTDQADILLARMIQENRRRRLG